MMMGIRMLRKECLTISQCILDLTLKSQFSISGMKGSAMRKKMVVVAIACVLIVIFLYAGCQVWKQGAEYMRAASSYSTLDAYIFVHPNEGTRPSITEGTVPAEPIATPTLLLPISSAHRLGTVSVNPTTKPSEPYTAVSEKEYDYPEIIWPEIDFTQLREINPDIVGWLYSEGIELNYPIVQAEDNARYLNMLFDGTHNKTGCPFLDTGNAGDFSDRHSIIYAHNRKDGSMFGHLVKYKEQNFYENHPRILLITEEARYVMEIFSGHIARSDSGAWKIEFVDDTEYANWQKVVCERSSITTNLVPEDDERILTLSTCSYEFDSARYVLHGVLRKAKMPTEK